MKALKVPKNKAEAVKDKLIELGCLDRTKRFIDMEGHVVIPVLDCEDIEVIAGLGIIVDAELPPRIQPLTPYENITNVCQIPPSKLGLLPDKWELLGNVLVLQLPGELERWTEEVCSCYARELDAKTVVRIKDIKGSTRKQNVEVLWGDGTETIHLENGIKYSMDVAKVMFSSGNIDERVRMAGLDCKEERVVDMFSGIGYFTLPLAVYTGAKHVTAYDINPDAHHYMKRNVELNHVEDKVTPILKNCLEAEEDVADRVIMGYLHDTHKYLEKAIKVLDKKGIIHYHENCPNELWPERPRNWITEAAKNLGKKADILQERIVKSYAPGVSHIVIDVRIY